MNVITINRGERTSIPFTITDAANNLMGRRVTASIAEAAGDPRVLRKVGGLPGSTSEVTISSQIGTQIDGFINVLVADFALLPKRDYAISLWVDDGNGTDRCVTVGGFDRLTIVGDVARLAT